MREHKIFWDLAAGGERQFDPAWIALLSIVRLQGILLIYTDSTLKHSHRYLRWQFQANPVMGAISPLRIFMILAEFHLRFVQKFT